MRRKTREKIWSEKRDYLLALPESHSYQALLPRTQSTKGWKMAQSEWSSCIWPNWTASANDESGGPHGFLGILSNTTFKLPQVLTTLQVDKSKNDQKLHASQIKPLVEEVKKIDRRLCTLVNGVKTSQRPYVSCQLLNDRIKLLYDSGADISIVANEVFQKALDKIPPHLRPKRVKIKLKAKSAKRKKSWYLDAIWRP